MPSQMGKKEIYLPYLQDPDNADMIIIFNKLQYIYFSKTITF